jgi:hypothetical protein
MQEEESQERALLPPANRDEPTVLLGLERAKDAELHVPLAGTVPPEEGAHLAAL